MANTAPRWPGCEAATGRFLGPERRGGGAVKVVYVANSVVPSRAANSIQVMKNCEAFANLGHDVTLLVPERDVEADGVEDVYEYYDVDPCFAVEKLPRPNLSSAGTFLVNYSIGRRAARLDPDLVYGRSTIACYFASRSGAPTVFESHAPMTESRFGRVKERFFRRLSRHSTFEKLVVISDSLHEYYEEHYPHLAGDVVVARNGSDPVESDGAAPFETADGRLQVGYVGNLYQGRGMDLIAELADGTPEVDVHVVGGTAEDIAHWQDQLGEPDGITFHGFVPQNDLDRYLLAFDVLLAPYQWDVATHAGHNTVQWMSPLKILEYMAAGRAIVASDLPAIEEILSDGETALLCDPEDVEEWADALERLREDPDLRRRLGRQARREFEDSYTWEKRAETVLNGRLEG